MKDLQKKQSLCEELNMNFDEVNELFAEETLQSMQMAKIVGGGTDGGLIKSIYEIISKANTVIEAWENIKKYIFEVPTKDPDMSGGTPIYDNGTIKIPEGTIEFTADSITIRGAFGVKILMGPTPIPQPTQYK
ncbi:hypothetical protein [Bacteroides fluxus]|jgi:hypothetical protein|nr:hypothetical protein [Bacteroides fluxus]MDY3788427.1 hypothetical protein [Bacteroides fluxus]